MFTRKTAVSVLISSFLSLAPSGMAAAEQLNGSLDPVSLVDPFIGTDAHGHTYPGASVPFGMVQLSPDTRNGTWDGCSAYHYSDKTILGFSHTHLSGTGCGDLGDVLFIPTSKPIDTQSEFNYQNYKSNFEHKDETARPGYYSVKLGDIKAELGATKRVGFHKYTFPKTRDAKIVIDLTHGVSDEPLELSINIVDDHTVTGLRRSRGWAKNQYVYFAAKFSKPFSSFGVAKDHDKPQAGLRTAEGKKLACWLDFDQSNSEQAVMAKVALSSASVESALKNLETETPDWNFDKVCLDAKETWQKELSKIEINTKDQNKAKSFYSALYHSMLAPTIVSDLDGSYRGADANVHRAEGFENYSTFSLWDTFRAEHSLLTLLEPNRVNDFIKSFVAQAKYQEKHLLPLWALASNETFCMIGYHSFPVIAEAYAKGFRGWDSDEVLKYMVENTSCNDWWAGKGYIPADKERESASKTLEFAYDDYCLAQFAKALGRKAEAEKFTERSGFFKNLMDRQSGFVRGRLADGSWRTPFDPTEVVNGGKPNGDFTEANAWQYTFFVPHDVPAMIDFYGGKSKFIEKLDQMFVIPITKKIDDEDVSGLIGQYAHGNEPSHHIAYLYSYAGNPGKTASRIKQIRDSMYQASPEGLCGNEDCGQMSAWYVFSALGFYPVNPVECNYVLGTPAFSRASLKLAGGKTFTLTAPGLSEKNIYIKSAKLNGKPLNKVYISHKDIVNGGTLELSMTDKPSTWGTTPDAAPPKP